MKNLLINLRLTFNAAAASFWSATYVIPFSATAPMFARLILGSCRAIRSSLQKPSLHPVTKSCVTVAELLEQISVLSRGDASNGSAGVS